MSSVGGQSIQSILNPNGYAQNVVYTNARSSYDCCVAALLDPVGSVFQHQPGYGCVILEATQCSAFDQSFVWTPYFGNLQETYVGNAYCGVMGGLPTPEQCGNQGMTWALYPDYDFATLQKIKPRYGPAVTTELGGEQSAPWTIYNSPRTWNEEFTQLSHVGYFFAQVTGTHTFDISYANDYLYMWLGPNAYRGWTRGNANLFASYNGGRFTYDLKAGQYYPLRIMLENTYGGGSFTMQIRDPHGEVVVESDKEGSPFLVQYSCD